MLTMFVWADTGEDILVPEFGGNLNPTVEKATAHDATEYKLYETDFSDLYSWETNVLAQDQGKFADYAYLTLSEQAVADGTSPKFFSPNMVLDTRLYDEILVNYTYFRTDADPQFTMRLGYSVNNGFTWADLSVQPAITQVTDGVDGAETYKAAIDLKKALPDIVVTNLVIKPYGDNPIYTGKTTKKVWNRAYTSGAFRMLDFSITCKSASANVDAKAVPVYEDHYDSLVIQKMIDDAKAVGKTEVMIPSVNPRDGSNTWVIDETIRVPSHMTLYINNCYLRAGDYFIGNIIANEKAWVPKMTSADEQTNNHIVGIVEANLAGGKSNGLTSDTVNKSGYNNLMNILLLLNNVNGFSIENIRIEESRFWGIAMSYSRNGVVRGIDVYDSRYAAEQDGIDVRCGNNDILIEDVAGRSGLLPIRRAFRQYINVRPVKLLRGIRSPLADRSAEDLDFIVIRENNEGEYSSMGGRMYEDTPLDMAIQNSVFTRTGVERVLRYAFRLAQTNGKRNRLTSATKSNGINHTMPFWDEYVGRIAAEYPDVEVSNVHIDALCAYFVTKPDTFDVVVASNLFGDILTDLGAAIVGGLGIAPSANINPEKQFPSMFEPVHGSAPDIAGKGIANPIAAIWCASLMLGHLGEEQAAEAVLEAVQNVLEEGRVLTPDLGGKAKTAEVGDYVCSKIRANRS
jgi:tartrate dehydrogenase/decarboxylase/D-malate dehydrogenase